MTPEEARRWAFEQVVATGYRPSHPDAIVEIIEIAGPIADWLMSGVPPSRASAIAYIMGGAPDGAA